MGAVTQPGRREWVEVLRRIAIVFVAVTALGPFTSVTPGRGEAPCLYKGMNAPDPAFFCYSRAAEFEVTVNAQRVPMRDNGKPGPVYLYCDLYQPALPGQGGTDYPDTDSTLGLDELGEGAWGSPPPLVHGTGTPAEGTFPGVVVYGVYAPVTRIVNLASWLAEHGYNVLVCDPRGVGLSHATAPGHRFEGAFSEIEKRDNYDVIEWMATQSWSNGRIGQIEESYYAITTDRVAGSRPPHLVTTFSIASSRSIYLDACYRGGAYTDMCPVAGTVVMAFSGGTANMVPFVAESAVHPLYDDYWRQIDPMTQWGAIDIPVLQWNGHRDALFPGAALETFVGLKAHATGSGTGGPWVIVDDSGHGSSGETGIGWRSSGAPLAWLDHWLMQLPTAPLPSSRITVYQMPRAGAERWEQLSDWPPPDVQQRRLYFTADGGLSTEAGLGGAHEYAVGSDSHVEFTSEPLVDDIAIAGSPKVHLRVKLTATDGIFVARLVDVDPDGVESELSGQPYFLKASHRLSHEYLTPITPGEFTDYVVPGWQISYRFMKGHRIRLKVSSSHGTLIEKAPAGTVTVASGNQGSYIELPVRSALP